MTSYCFITIKFLNYRVTGNIVVLSVLFDLHNVEFFGKLVFGDGIYVNASLISNGILSKFE